MDYTTPSPIPHREEDLMTYPMSAEGIEWEVLQDCITSFLGPEAFASLERTQDGEDVYWVTATRPFLPSQINDLKAFSAEFLEDREAAASKHRRPSRHPKNRGGRKQKQATSPIHVQLVLPSLHQNAYLMLPPPSSSSPSSSASLNHCRNCENRPPHHHHHPHSSAASSRAGTLA
ncbi:hypothetical protein B9Z19DRAFT_1098372 [Tuber borchii]|uniref:Uncharacterized protein n=1 Tax=Tuber borchii TaxID=42251 RepID=A0A2T7A8C0_TUBBO|nr:hypothetical protein B9Z19DRAFT_1098372 [Tuber borchii]